MILCFVFLGFDDTDVEIYSESSTIEILTPRFAQHWSIHIDSMSSSKFGVNTDAMDGQKIYSNDPRGNIIGR